MAQTHSIGTHATTVHTDNDGYTVVTYHSTQVVKFNHETVTLDTGGWFSATTKSRMNQASNQFRLGYQVYQKAGKWFVWFPSTDRAEIEFTGQSVSFER